MIVTNCTDENFCLTFLPCFSTFARYKVQSMIGAFLKSPQKFNYSSVSLGDDNRNPHIFQFF